MPAPRCISGESYQAVARRLTDKLKARQGASIAAACREGEPADGDIKPAVSRVRRLVVLYCLEPPGGPHNHQPRGKMGVQEQSVPVVALSALGRAACAPEPVAAIKPSSRLIVNNHRGVGGIWRNIVGEWP